MAGFAGRILILLAVAAAMVLVADDTAAPELTARQLYYKPKTAAKPVKKATKHTDPVKKTEDPEPAATPSPVTDTSTPAVPEEAEYLGLRYSLTDGKTGQEVDSSKVFHNGDTIRLHLQSNSSGFLYVLNEEPTGVWTTLFPSAEVMNNNNRLERGRAAEIPSGQNFEFYAEPGTEKLFVVLSREREPDMESLIGYLKNRSGPKKSDFRMLQAQNRPDPEVERMRAKLTGRGLRVQPVRSASNGSGETAVYVAASSPATSRVVTEIVLKHE